jgi:uncharacterized protein (TIGR00304 family)
MNRSLLLAIILGFVGIILLGISATSGEGNAGVFLIFPVFYGSGIYAFLGVLCIMGAMMLGFMGLAQKMLPQEDDKPASRDPNAPPPEKSVKGGGVVLIGPIPIVFGSSPKMAVILMIMALAIMVVAMIFIYFSFL